MKLNISRACNILTTVPAGECLQHTLTYSGYSKSCKRYVYLMNLIINDWTFQRKMFFIPGLLKQAPELCFSTVSNIIYHPDLVFNNNMVHKTTSYKHLGRIIRDKITFKEDIDKKLCKTKKGIGILRMYHFIPRSTLQIIYTTFQTKYSRMDWVKCLNRPYHFKFLKAVFHKFHVVCSWMLCPIYSYSSWLNWYYLWST